MSDWYEKAKQAKEEAERRKRLEEQNFQQNLQRLKRSQLVEKIELVADRVNRNTFYKVEIQDLGSRIEVFLDSEQIELSGNLHFSIVINHDGIFLKYGRGQSKTYYSEPIAIEPETVSEKNIEEWIENLSRSDFFRNMLLRRVKSNSSLSTPRQRIYSKICSLMKLALYILLLVSIVVLIYSMLKNGCG